MAAEIREPAVRGAAVGVLVPVRGDPVGAVVLVVAGTGRASGLAACVALRPHAHAAPDCDVGADLSAHADGGTYDLVSERAGVGRWSLE